jgi:hypothetical protein
MTPTAVAGVYIQPRLRFRGVWKYFLRLCLHHSRERECGICITSVGAGKLVDGLPFQKAQPERPVTKAGPKRCVPSDRPLLIGGSMETGSYILVGKAARPFRKRKLDLSMLLIRSRGGTTMSNTPKATAKNCLRPYAIWDWRASCPNASD